jgi:hypothetical protein
MIYRKRKVMFNIVFSALEPLFTAFYKKYSEKREESTCIINLKSEKMWDNPPPQQSTKNNP